MRKFTLLLLFFCAQQIVSQETVHQKQFNFGPMFRVYGFVPINTGDNYLSESNKSQVSVGGNLSFFEYLKVRLAFGVDHAFYKTNDVYLAADISTTRHTSLYFIGTYKIAITPHLSAAPYLGVGWSQLIFKRQDKVLFNHDASITKQHGGEYRAGFYLDYKVDKMVSFYTGANFVGSKYRIGTVPELQEYFGKAQTIQICFGLKLGYTLNDKRNEKPEEPTK